MIIAINKNSIWDNSGFDSVWRTTWGTLKFILTLIFSIIIELSLFIQKLQNYCYYYCLKTIIYFEICIEFFLVYWRNFVIRTFKQKNIQTIYIEIKTWIFLQIERCINLSLIRNLVWIKANLFYSFIVNKNDIEIEREINF